jgi:hypothetical protein
MRCDRCGKRLARKISCPPERCTWICEKCIGWNRLASLMSQSPARGCALVILRTPATHHETFEGRTHIGGMEALILLATLGGPMMFARIGVMRTLNRNAKRTFYLTRKDKRTNQNQRAR